MYEEAGLDLSRIAADLIHVGDFEGGGRNERDTPTAWSRTSLFTVVLDEAHAALPVAGGDDACDARRWPLDALLEPLAFDHARLLARAADAVALC